MTREEKRRKFNEAVIHMLYPPPQPHTRNEDSGVNDYDEETIPGLKPRHNTEILTSETEADDLGSHSSTSNDEERESGSQKLTRAQRKRLRRKKIKIESSRRRQIVGPLLPPAEQGSPSVRRNAAEKEEAEACSGEPSLTSGTKSKVKQRRIAKKRDDGGQSVEDLNKSCNVENVASIERFNKWLMQ